MPTRFPLVTLHGFECVLLLPPIRWQRRPKVIMNLAIDSAEGRSGIAARASDHPEVRLSFDYGYTFEEAEAIEFMDLLETLDPEQQRILVPIWPDMHLAADYTTKRKWISQHWLNIDVDTGAYTLDASGGHPESVGLAMCGLLELPERALRTDIDTDVNLRAEEDSPWEARIEINTLDQATWIFEADWASPPADTSRWQQKRQRLGHGRLSARTGTRAPVKRGQSAGFTFTSPEEMRRAMTFWAAHRGPLLPFTVPLYFRPGWDGTTGGIPVMQVHFYEETFALEFEQPGEARARLVFDQDFILIEGQPEQARPSRPYLVKFWWSGSTTKYTWTDWPIAYTHDSLVYTPQKIELQQPTETLVPGENTWSMLADDFEGCPFRAFGRLSIERQLLCEIREYDPAVPNTAALVFSGEAKSAPNKANIYTVKLALFGDALKHMIPGQFVQQGCNNVFCDDLCGLEIEDYKVTGTLVAASDTIIVDVTCSDASPADDFAAGFASFGAGDDVELRFIMRSEPISGGQRLTLNRPLVTSGAAAAVAFYPGCDQQFEGGCASYDNQDRFFGAPYKPAWIETVSSGFKTKTGK